MGKLLTLGAFAVGCGAAYLLSRRGEATTAPQTGRTNVQDEAFKVTLAEFTAEKDAAKKAAIKTRLDAEIARRKAAEVAKAKAPKPLYPVGLEVRFGKRQATIIDAKQDAKGAWSYDIDLKAGELLGLGDGVYTKTEPEMRQIIAGEVGQPLVDGQAFPAGIQVYRGGQGGKLEKVEKNAAGVWIYTVAGWGNTVNQSELLGILGK
jgi:hypothetical protein